MTRPGEIPAQIMRVDLKSGKQRPWKVLSPRDRTALGLLAPIRFAFDCETRWGRQETGGVVPWLLRDRQG